MHKISRKPIQLCKNMQKRMQTVVAGDVEAIKASCRRIVGELQENRRRIVGEL
jgi:hypothetical protein